MTDPDRDGTLSVVVSFRAAPVPLDAWESLRDAIRIHLGAYRVDLAAVLGPIDVAVRKIGSQGEQSQMEGTGP
jgi:hypothetical protein